MAAEPSSTRAWVGVGLLVAAGAGLYLLATSQPPVEPPPPETVVPLPGAPDAAVAEDAPRGPVVRAAHDDPRPDILLFTIDTLRADHVGSYGYERATTPTIDAVAARGTRFARAYSTSSWTLPAVASLLTSVIPSEHGVLHSELNEDDQMQQEALSTELPSLVAALHDAGYHTVGITANGHLATQAGFARGFDDYRCLGFTQSDRVEEALEGTIAELLASETPYFLWVHVLDPHTPYVPTAPWFDAWWPESRQRYPQIDETLFAEAIRGIIVRDHLDPTDVMDYARTAYDSEVRRDDEVLRRLLERIDDGHLAVVITADHGEEFGDHLGLGHGHTLFEEVIHVPLVVSVPGSTPGVSSALVSILDVLPTLVEIADRPAPAGIAGRSLVPLVHGATAEPRELVLETGRGEVVRAIFDGRYKYGERVTPNPIEALFDEQEDPHERHPCGAEHPEIVGAMRQRMLHVLEEAAARRPEIVEERMTLPPSVRDQLEALGYAH